MSNNVQNSFETENLMTFLNKIHILSVMQLGHNYKYMNIIWSAINSWRV